MKTLLNITLALVLATAAGAQTMGVSAGQDLDDLWARAQAQYDVSGEDAVVLLESRRIDIADDGTVSTQVHRVVHIGSAQGIRGYADLRIPWNSANSTLDVEILRTWMDGRWWPDPDRISETAVVHTLPYAVNHAHDYTTMRETMLLHDGVELPCIMETRYTLTERGLPGADGVFVLPQRDPAMRVQLVVSAPPGVELKHEAMNGAPEAVESAADGRRVLTWTLEPASALRLPIAVEPAAYEPTVVWSTWASFEAMSATWREGFEAAQILEGALTDSLFAVLDPCDSLWEMVRATIDFVNDNVRPVAYDDRFWRFNPRPATRTWETAYGTYLDRTVLLAAILGTAMEVEPMFVGRGNSDLQGLSVPHLNGAGDLHLILKIGAPGDPQMPYVIYDPAGDRFLDNGDIIRRLTLRLGDDPRLHERRVSDSMNRFDVTLTAAEDGGWTGTAYLDATRNFAPYIDMLGVSGEMQAWAQSLVASVLSGAEVTTANPVIFMPDRVALGIEFTLAAPDETETDAPVTLQIDGPAGGLLDSLPGDIHLPDESREAPVRLTCPMGQQVQVRIRKAAAIVAHLPAARNLENETGAFNLEVVEAGDDVIVTRQLMVNGSDFDADAWPQLRALLLEEAEAANGTIVLKPTD